MTDEMARVQRAISALHYDFGQFTVPDFVRYIETTRERDIILNGVPLEPGLHGLWIQAETADYVFFDQGAHPVHQVHSILHELGHLILRHHPHDLAQVLSSAMVTRFRSHGCVSPQGHCRMWSPNDSSDECEAELFVYLPRREIYDAGRLNALTRKASSVNVMDRFTRSLGDGD